MLHGSLSPQPELTLTNPTPNTNQGVPRNAISLFLEIDEAGKVARRWHARTRIVNDDATTYDAFDADHTAAPAGSRALLAQLSGAKEADEMVAWCMIEYNAYFGGLLVAQAGRAAAQAGGEGGEEGEGVTSGLLRVQPKEGGVATYAFSSSEDRLHSVCLAGLEPSTSRPPA